MNKFDCKVIANRKNLETVIELYGKMIEWINKVFVPSDNLLIKKTRLTNQTEKNINAIIEKYSPDQNYFLIRIDETSSTTSLTIHKRRIDHDLTIIIKKNGFDIIFKNLKISITDKKLCVYKIDKIRETINETLLKIICKYNVSIDTFLDLLSLKNVNAIEKKIKSIYNYYKNEHKKELIKSIKTAFDAKRNTKEFDTTIKREVEREWGKRKTMDKKGNSFYSDVSNIRNSVVEKLAPDSSSNKKTRKRTKLSTH